MAGAGAAATFVVALLFGAGARQESFADSAARELAIRAWAMGEHAEGLALGDALEADIAVRTAALRAAERGFEVGAFERGELGPRLTRAWLAGDEWSDNQQVRSSLLNALAAGRVLTAHDPGGRVFAELLRPWPTARLAATRAIASGFGGDRRALLRVCLDPDERVATLARDGVLLGLPETDELVAALALAIWNDDRAEWPDFLARLARARPAETLLDRLANIARDRISTGALEAIRWSSHARGDIVSIVEVFPGPDRLRAVFTHAARAARVTSQELGRALFTAAEVRDDPTRFECLRGAADALAPEVLLELALRSQRLDDDEIGFCWRAARGRVASWDAARVRPWFEKRADGDLRLEIVSLLAAEHAEFGARATGELLVACLSDSDVRVVDAAFAALCEGSDVEPWLDALRARWLRFDEPRRISALAELPRSIAARPFEHDLIALASTQEHGATAFELLAPFAPNRELATLARAQLELALEQFESAAELDRDIERRCCALVRALHVQSEGRDVDGLFDALRRTGSRSVEIGKLAAWSLGQTEAGRATLDPWLASEQSRVRIEAELMLAPTGRDDALAGLEADWAQCDSELKSRALRAAAASATERGWAFVRRIALDRQARVFLRQLAVDLLAERRPIDLETLIEAANARELDLRAHAISALGATGDPRALEHLRGRVQAWETLDLSTEEARLRFEVDRESVWSALARANRIDAELEGRWLREPMLAAPNQLRARFRGDRQSGSEFAWRVELDVAAALARERRVLAALQRAGAWWSLDARLLAAMGERVREHGDLAGARALFRAALIGLRGEADNDERRSRAFDVRHRLLEVAEALRDWATFEEIALGLLEDFRSFRGLERSFEREFGDFVPERGEDGLARLQSAAFQARAWAALEENRLEAAREAARRADDSLGHSKAAREAQDKLEVALAAREAK